MSKRWLATGLVVLLSAGAVLALTAAEETYINQLTYRNNRLNLVAKTRLVDEKRHYSSTDIRTDIFSYEAYSNVSTNISTSNLSRAEVKEIEEWFIYKGDLTKLSDLEFLKLVGEEELYQKYLLQEEGKEVWRSAGNTAIWLGVATMIGGVGFSAGQSVITGGALLMTSGFFLSALNSSPAHYLQPDFVQSKIDEYNLALKKKLGLPFDFN